MADATKESGDNVMLFVHGIESRYGNVNKAELEKAAERYAKVHGYSGIRVLSSGTDAQIREALKHGQRYGRQPIVDALKDEKIKGVFGFSRGGNLLRGILQDPKMNEEARKHVKEAVLLGSPETKGTIPNVNTRDIPYMKDVSHMHMTQTLAEREVRRHALAGIRERTRPPEEPKPQAPRETSPPSPAHQQPIKPREDGGVKSNPGTMKKSGMKANPATNKKHSFNPATSYDNG